MMTIRNASRDDFAALWRLYSDVCAHQEHDAYGPCWSIGIYPTESDLLEHLDAGDAYLALDDGRAVGGMVLTRTEDPAYLGIDWPSGAIGDGVSVIHLLCAHPKARGLGIGRTLVREAERLARVWGKRAIHLDVVPGNLAASRIYLQEGFALVCHHIVHYEDLGDTALEMYELAL